MKGTIDMKCIRENPTHTEERCVFPPFIQSKLEKGKVLCRYHAMDEIVNSAHQNKWKIGKRFVKEQVIN